ncbi:hypothetical protein ACFXC8_11810 [Streptomyces sp. NPDC059441]|uniref:hypothetical protein n=1 Tax=Streptomyces sp. NPDC059441 TaxID=3346829 RepID=UPI0036BC2E84
MHDSQIGGEQPFWQLPDRLRAVGPRWHPPLLQLHEQILALDPGYGIEDLKEKFGAVRIQVTASAPRRSRIRSLLTAIEEQSASIREFCGRPRSRRRRGDAQIGWIKAVCDSCHAAWSDRSIMTINGVVRHRHVRNH